MYNEKISQNQVKTDVHYTRTHLSAWRRKAVDYRSMYVRMYKEQKSYKMNYNKNFRV